MTLFSKFLIYAKNIYNHKNGYTLLNAYKYFGEDYQQFLSFYNVWLSAKELNSDKTRITYIQMQQIKELLDRLEKIKEETVKTEALRDKAFQGLLKTTEEGDKFKIATDTYSEYYNIIDEGNAYIAYDIYNNHLKQNFNQVFDDFVGRYYTYDEESSTFILNYEGYIAQRDKIFNDIYKEQLTKIETAISTYSSYVDKVAELKDIKNDTIGQLDEILQEITSLNESIFFE